VKNAYYLSIFAGERAQQRRSPLLCHDGWTDGRTDGRTDEGFFFGCRVPRVSFLSGDVTWLFARPETCLCAQYFARYCEYCCKQRRPPRRVMFSFVVIVAAVLHRANPTRRCSTGKNAISAKNRPRNHRRISIVTLAESREKQGTTTFVAGFGAVLRGGYRRATAHKHPNSLSLSCAEGVCVCNHRQTNERTEE